MISMSLDTMVCRKIPGEPYEVMLVMTYIVWQACFLTCDLYVSNGLPQIGL